MRPVAFDYTAPGDVAGVVQALVDGGDDAKIISGGQSLMPVLRMRMAAPELLVDLRKVDGLREIRQEGGELVIGASVTHHTLANDPLVGFLHAEGVPLDHIKPHGSLYGMVARDEDLMDAVCDVAEQYDVGVFGMAGTAHERVAARRGVPFTSEFYVDLGYRADGSLIIARRPQATPVDVATERARLALSEGMAIADTGERLPMTFTSICVHSDTPNATDVARAIRAVVEAR